jgi:hypothetical protein
MIYLELRIKMPEDELEPFLRALRAWERGRPEIEASLLCEATGLTTDAIEAILTRVDPPVPVRHVRAWTDAQGHQHTGWHHRSDEETTPSPGRPARTVY